MERKKGQQQEQLAVVALLQVDHSWGEEIAPALIPAGMFNVHLFFWLLLYLWRFGLTCLNCRLTSEEVVRLNSGLEHIMDIMGETVSEHVIKTTIVR